MKITSSQLATHILNAYGETTKQGKSYRGTIHANLSYEGRGSSYTQVEVFRDGVWDQVYHSDMEDHMNWVEENGRTLNDRWIKQTMKEILEMDVETDLEDN